MRRGCPISRAVKQTREKRGPFSQNKVHRGERKMSSPFETRIAGVVVCFDGSGYVTQDLTLTSDTQLIRIEAWYQDFFWMGK
jgi:hypothetical protein